MPILQERNRSQQVLNLRPINNDVVIIVLLHVPPVEIPAFEDILKPMVRSAKRRPKYFITVNESVVLTAKLRAYAKDWLVLGEDAVMNNHSIMQDLGLPMHDNRDYPLRELDNRRVEPVLDLSIGKCGNYLALAQAGGRSLFTLDYPSPGSENPCTGLRHGLHLKLQASAERVIRDALLKKRNASSLEERTERMRQFRYNICNLTTIRNSMWLNSSNHLPDFMKVYSCMYPNHRQQEKYKSVLEGLPVNCSTLDEMIAKARNKLSGNESTVMEYFLHDVSRYKPPSSATRHDMAQWAGNGSNPGVVAVIAAGLGFVLGSIFGWLFGFAKSGGVGGAGAGAGGGGSGNIDEMLDDADDFGDDDYGNDGGDNDQDEETTTTTSTTTEATTSTTTPTTTTLPPNAVCIVQKAIEKAREEGLDIDLTPCGSETTPEDSTLIPMSELARISTEGCAYCNGAENEADLLLTRCGIFESDWEETGPTDERLEGKYVCKKHRDTLGLSWYLGIKKRREGGVRRIVCNFPNTRGFVQHNPNKPPLAHQTYTVSKRESQIILQKYKKLVVIGTSVCRSHRGNLDDYAAEDRVDYKGIALSPPPPKTLAESPVLSRAPIIRVRPEADPDYQPPPQRTPARAGPEVDIEKSIKELARVAGIASVHVPAGPFRDLIRRTQRRRIEAIRQLLTIICQHLGKESVDYVLEAAAMPLVKKLWPGFGNRHLHEILNYVKEAYFNSKNSDERKFALSLVSNVIPLSELQRYIPGLTAYFFSASRKFFAVHQGAHAERPMATRRRFDEAAVLSFVEHISSPNIIVDLPTGGTATATLSTGQRTEIPNVRRTLISSRIVDLFNQYQEESGVAQGEHTLSRSSMLRILKCIPAQESKAIQGLDYITFAGLEAIDDLLRLLKEDAAAGKIPQVFVKEVSLLLKEYKQYIKADFKAHLHQESRVADHCMVHALSDPRNSQMNKPCNHEHDQVCGRCERGKQALGDIQKAYLDKEMVKMSCEERNNKVYRITESINAIQGWKAHQLRTVYLDNDKFSILNNLGQNTVFFTMDWAMKYLPIQYREEQTSWYGKRGISWHIAVANIRVKAAGDLPGTWKESKKGYYSRVVVHVFDGSAKQDATSVTGIVLHLLKEVHAELPWIESAIFRSDNAGCYHGAQLIASIHHIADESGIKILKWIFSETQSGKGPADRAAATVKRQIRYFVNEGHGCCTSREFILAAKAHNGLKSNSFYEGTISGENAGSQQPAKIPGIKTYFTFDFRYGNEKGIHVWKYPGIGSGSNIAPSFWSESFKVGRFAVSFEAHQNALTKPASHLVWKFWKDVEAAAVQENPVMMEVEEDTDVATEDTQSGQTLFTCPEEGCTKTFMKHGNLLRHILYGKHVYRAERETIFDFAINSFKLMARSNEILNRVPELREAINSDNEDSENYVALPQGWAIQADRASKRFTPDQLIFLREKFDEGLRGRKADPRKVAEEMMVTLTDDRKKRFQPQDYLTWVQISSFFSRLAADMARRPRQPVPDAGEGSSQGHAIARTIDDVIKAAMADFDNHAQQVGDEVSHRVEDFEDEDTLCLPTGAENVINAIRESNCMNEQPEAMETD